MYYSNANHPAIDNKPTDQFSVGFFFEEEKNKMELKKVRFQWRKNGCYGVDWKNDAAFCLSTSKTIKRLHIKPKRICTVAQFVNVSSQTEIAYCILQWQLWPSGYWTVEIRCDATQHNTNWIKLNVSMQLRKNGIHIRRFIWYVHLPAVIILI